MSEARLEVRCACLLLVGYFGVGHLLAQQAPSPGEIRWLEGHTKPIYAVAYSPDGKFIYSASFDHTVKIWDRQSHRLLRSFSDHANGVLSLAVARPGQQFATSGMDRQILLYDVPTREFQGSGGLAGEGVAVAASPDGAWLITADKGPLLRLWNGITGQHLRDFPGLTTPVTGVVLTADLKRVAASTTDGFVRVWDVQQGTLLGALTVPAATALDASSDGQQLATVGTDGILRVSQWPTALPKVLNGHSQGITGLVISPEGKQAVTCSTDATVRHFDLIQARELKAFAGQQGPALSLAVARDFSQLATGNPTGQIKFWKLDGTDLKLLAGHTGNVTALTYHPEGKLIASAGQDGTVRVWQQPQLEYKTLPGHSQPVSIVAVSASRKLMVTAADKLVQVFDTEGKLLRQLNAGAHPVSAVTVAEEDHFVVAGDAAGGIHAWSLADGKLQGELAGHTGPVTGLAAHPTAKEVSSSGADGKVRVWKLPLLENAPVTNSIAMPARAMDAHPAQAAGVILTPDGSQLLSSGDDKLLKLWDAGGKLIRQYGGSQTALRRLAIRSDLKQIAAGSDAGQSDKGLYVWNFETAALIRRIETPAPVTGVAFSAEGGRIASSHVDNRIRIYGAEDGLLWEEITCPHAPLNLAYLDDRTLLAGQADNQSRLFAQSIHRIWQAHQGQIKTLSYSADGKVLLSGGDDKTLRVWNAQDGREIANLTGCSDVVTHAAFAPDQKSIVASSLDRQVRIWNAPPFNPQGASIALSPTQTLPDMGSVHLATISPDGNIFVTSGNDFKIHSWDRATGFELEQFAGHTATVTRLEFSADGQTLVSGANDNSCRIWRPTTNRLQKAHPRNATAVKFAPDGSYIVTAADDGKVLRWNSASLKAEQTYSGSNGPIRCVAISPDGQFVASGCEDRQLRVWKSSDAQAVIVQPTPAGIVSLKWSPTGSKLAVGGSDNTVRTFQCSSPDGQLKAAGIQEGLGHTAPVTGCAFTADERLLFTVSADRTWKRWTSARAAPIVKLSGHSAQVYSLDYSPDGKLLASAAGDKTVRIWNTETGKPVAVCNGHQGQVFSVSFSPNGQTVASASADKTVRIWKTDGTFVKDLKDGSEDGLYSVQYYADPNFLVAGGLAKKWLFWNVNDGKPQRTVSGHTDHIYRAIFNPNWNRVASVDYSGHLFIWDTGSGNPLHHQQLPVPAAYSVAYAPDGKELVIGSQDARLIVMTIPAPGQ